MLLPADMLSHTLMPWILAAPALPLAFMISRKNLFSGINVAILLACTTSMLTNVFFSLIVRAPGSLRTDIYLVGILLEFSLAMVMLWKCAEHRFIQGIVLASGVMLCGSLGWLIALGSDVAYLKTLLSSGHAAIAVLSFVSLAHASFSTTRLHGFFTDIPQYWVMAGLMLHFGSTPIFLAVANGHSPAEWASQWDFGLLFTVSSCARFVLFTTAVIVGRKQETNPEMPFPALPA